MAAGKSLLGQAPLGKPMYGGGYINGAQQVFSGNRPSNAFGGLGCGNPLAGLGWFFKNTVRRAQAVPSQLGRASCEPSASIRFQCLRPLAGE